MITPFGKEVRKFRVDQSLNMKAMAEKLKVSTAYLSAIETGKKSIPEGFVEKIKTQFALNEETYKKLQLSKELSVGEYRLKVGDGFSDISRQTVAMFARSFSELKDDDVAKIKRILEGVE